MINKKKYSQNDLIEIVYKYNLYNNLDIEKDSIKNYLNEI